MRKKIFLLLVFAIEFLGLSSCTFTTSSWSDSTSTKSETNTNKNVDMSSYPMVDDEDLWNEVPVVDETDLINPETNSSGLTIYNKRVPPLNSLIVCRDKQCAPAELSTSKEYIYNSLAHLVDNNLDDTALLCEGNAQTHTCINPYLTVPAKVGVTPAYVFFDGVKVIDAMAVKGKTALNLVLGYNLSYNGQTPTVCKPDRAIMYVKGNNDVVLNGNGFNCEMTSVGATTIRIMFMIDYIDMDYGYIGGYYYIGLSGPAYGGGSGYGLIRLPKDAHPLKPILTASYQKELEKNRENAQPSFVKPSAKVTSSSLPEEGIAPIQVVEQGDLENAEKESAISTAGQDIHSNDSVEVYPSNAARPVATQNKQPVISQGSRESRNPDYEEIYVGDLDEYIK